MAAPTLGAQSPTQPGAQTVWSPTSPYPNSDIAAQSCVTSNGSIYCVGGYNSTRAPSVYEALFTTSHCFTNYSPACYDLAGNITSGVYYAQANASGVFDWALTTPYANQTDNGEALGIMGQSCVTSRGTIYCVGGIDNVTLSPTDLVFYSNLTSHGDTGWAQTTSYPFDVSFQSCVVSVDEHQPYVYCVGGLSETGSSTAVFSAPLYPNGVGEWSYVSDYPISAMGQSCVVANQTIYCVGGFSPNGGPFGFLDATYYARLEGGGVSYWTPTTPYAGGYVTDLSCVSLAGDINCVGGFGLLLTSFNSPGTVFDALRFNSSTFAAPISNLTGIGTWNSTAPYGGGGIAFQSCAVANSTTYCVGGVTNPIEFTGGVYYESVIPPNVTVQTQTEVRSHVTTSYATVISTSTAVGRQVLTTETTTVAGPTSTVSHTYTSTATQPLPTTGSISVFVYSPSGTPVSGASVALSGGSSQTSTSDSSGQVTYSGLPLGSSYTVSATVSGAHLAATVSLTSSTNQATVVLQPSPSTSSGFFYIEIGGVVLVLAIVAILLLLLLRRRSR